MKNQKDTSKKTTGHRARITISGPGVLHVRSSEIVKTDEGQRQIKALGELKDKNLIGVK